MQIKVTRYYSYPLGRATVEKTAHTSVGEDVEQLEYSYLSNQNA